MGYMAIVLIGVGLSMDAFAVSVCKGLGMQRINKRQCIIIGLYFGGFQALMPLIGWALGTTFESYITKIDHWITFILLAAIGGKMIFDAIKERKEEVTVEMDQPLDHKQMILLAIATSIDALAVGVTFAFLQVHILPSILLIGITTFLISMLGVVIGNLFGAKNKYVASLAGGAILILMGIRILLEHLGIIGV